MKRPGLFSSLTIGIIISTCFFIDFQLKNWNKQFRVIEHDIHWYYAYLPAYFIYDDIRLEMKEYEFWDGYSLFWPVKTPEGHNIIKSTMGLSYLYSPFFIMAHACAKPFGFLPDGCSAPYKMFLLLSTIFYLFIGLIYVRRLLRRFGFADIPIAITLALLGLGTHLLCYSSQSAPMPHAYNFCLFAMVFWYSLQWYESPKWKTSLLLGLLAGLITLIRPSNGLVLLFCLAYGITGKAELRQRLQLLRNHPLQLALIAAVASLVWLPQLLYWHKVTGHYIYYSYTNEGFFFGKPKIIDGLFSFRKGWLLYTPLMVFALAGIFFMKGELKKMRPALVLFLVLNLYIVFSWWCWWYGGSFGQRSLIESYALLAMPLAAFVKYILESKLYLRLALLGISLFFVWLNIFQTFQFEYLSLHCDGTTKELYFKQFGKMNKIPDFDKYVDPPDYEAAVRGER